MIRQATRKTIATGEFEVIENDERAAPDDAPDGGYGWVIVLASFFVHVCVLGSIYSFGIFFSEYIDAFNASQGAVAWIGSIGGGMMLAIAAYTGAWADQYGNGLVVFIGAIFVGAGYLLGSYSTELWHLFLTQGLITGIGYSLAFISGISVVGQWFSKRRGLAVGLAVSGSGLGQFAITLITESLIENYGWRAALRILACILFTGLALSGLAIKRALPLRKPDKRDSAIKYFKEKNFNVLYFGGLFATLGLFMPFVHLPRYSEDEGVSKSNAALTLAIMGIFSALGRIIIGWAADGLGKILMLQMCAIAGGLSTLCWLACTNFATITTYACVYGFFSGGIISLIPAVCASQYGVQRLGSIMGLVYTSGAFGNLLSAPIGGFLYDINGNYDVAIPVSAGLMLLGGVILLFLRKNEVEEIPMSPEDCIAGGSVEVEESSAALVVSAAVVPSEAQEGDNDLEANAASATAKEVQGGKTITEAEAVESGDIELENIPKDEEETQEGEHP